MSGTIPGRGSEARATPIERNMRLVAYVQEVSESRIMDMGGPPESVGTIGLITRPSIRFTDRGSRLAKSTPRSVWENETHVLRANKNIQRGVLFEPIGVETRW